MLCESSGMHRAGASVMLHVPKFQRAPSVPTSCMVQDPATSWVPAALHPQHLQLVPAAGPYCWGCTFTNSVPSWGRVLPDTAGALTGVGL